METRSDGEGTPSSCIRSLEQKAHVSDCLSRVRFPWQEAGLGLQLRVYRGVPVVNLNAVMPDKKVVVRPQVILKTADAASIYSGLHKGAVLVGIVRSMFGNFLWCVPVLPSTFASIARGQ